MSGSQQQGTDYVVFTNSAGGPLQHGQLQSTNALTNDVTNFTELIYQMKIIATDENACDETLSGTKDSGYRGC